MNEWWLINALTGVCMGPFGSWEDAAAYHLRAGLGTMWGAIEANEHGDVLSSQAPYDHEADGDEFAHDVRVTVDVLATADWQAAQDRKHAEHLREAEVAYMEGDTATAERHTLDGRALFAEFGDEGGVRL